MARVDWPTVALGGTLIPILLVHGIGRIFTTPSAASLFSSTALSSLDALWWPGSSYATITAAMVGWLDPTVGLEWTERADPVNSEGVDVASLTARLTDVDLAATALFGARDAAVSSFITAEVTAAATTVYVVSTAGFASSGVLYLGREAILYSGTTSTSFTGCTRGAYGSQAQRHAFAASSGYGLGNPEVTDRPVEVVGRLATLWSLQVEGGVATKMSLEFVGHVGAGPLLDADGDAWSLPIDHAVKRLAQSPRAPTVTIGGYSHAGNAGARAGFDVDGTTVYGRGLVRDGLSPVVDTFYNTAGTATRYVITLTEDAAAPDNGGWHPSREAFVEALNEAAASVVAGGETLSYTLDSEGQLHAAWTFTSARGGSNAWAWTVAPLGIALAPTTSFEITAAAMPEAWVPIVGATRIYLSDGDYATVPPVPSPAPTDATCLWALVWDEQGTQEGASVRRAVTISANVTTAGVNYVVGTPATGGQYIPPTQSLAIAGVLRRRRGIIVTTPTTARVCLFVAADSWVPALRSAVMVFSDDLADGSAQAFDWARIEAIAALYAPTIRGRREYIVDADTTILSLVANECALQGFVLVPYQGRIAIARIVDAAATETRADTITTADTTAGAPAYSRGADGVVNTMELEFPDAKAAFNFVDQTSRAAYGPSRSTIKVRVPPGLFERAIDGALVTDTLAALAMSAIGPMRYPAEQVEFGATLRHAGLAVGDTVGVTLWRVPNGSGGRGLVDRTAQVMRRSPVLYRDGTDGLVRFTLRLSPTNLCGWAPGALVAAGGITGAAVTLDTTTFAASGCSQSGVVGGAQTFAAGDKVRLVELGTDAPATALQREVLSVAGAVVTLTVAPGATFATLAATALKVAILYDDWDVVADAQLPGWAYLANTTNLLVDGGTSTPARRYA